MKLLKNEKITKKIIILLIILLSFNFIFTNYSQAKVSDVLISPIQTLMLWMGDGVLGMLQKSFMGSEAIIEGFDEFVKRDADDYYEQATDNFNPLDWLVATAYKVYANTGPGRLLLKWLSDTGYTGPVVLVKYSIPAIVSNKIPAFDINFFSPMKTTSGQPKSTATVLHDVVQKWYAVLRNIALIALLSVLVYIGIKIILSSSSEEKAKYKSKIINWVVAMVILFTLQYIMATAIYVVNLITDSISSGMKFSTSSGTGALEGTEFSWNGDGYDAYITEIRTNSEMAETTSEQLGYTIMYIALIVLTIMFSIIYLKRTVYISFLTMISPLIAMTYPIDKEGDGKAQAFGFWIKEYIFNIIMQPIHLLLYYIFVGSAIELASENVIYGLIALGMIIPAEKLVRQMFNIEKAGNDSSLSAGGFFEGALAASAISNLASIGKGSKGGKGSPEALEEGKDQDDNGIRTADPFELDDDDDDDDDDDKDELEEDDDELKLNDNLDDDMELDDHGQAMLDWATNPDNMMDTGMGIGNLSLNQGDSNLNQGDSNFNINEENNANGRMMGDNKGKIDDSDNEKLKLPNKKPIKGYKKVGRGLSAIAKKNYKSVGRGALKIAGGLAKFTLGATGGTIGLAAAVATGNAKNIDNYMLKGIGVGVGAASLAGSVAKGVSKGAKNVKKEAVNITDQYKIGANNLSEKEYQDQVVIPRLKKQNAKSSDVKEKYTREFGDTKLLESSTRDEMYNAGIVDENLIIKALKEKQKNPQISDKELTRDAILASGVKNYKDMESVEKRMIKNLEQKGFYKDLEKKMEKDGKFKDVDKKLDKKFVKINENDKLTEEEKGQMKQDLREKEINKRINKEKVRLIEPELSRIEKLSGI